VIKLKNHIDSYFNSPLENNFMKDFEMVSKNGVSKRNSQEIEGGSNN